ncbi:MAG: glycoside hydrolase family 31 protein [Lacibacter sp.]|nr:glycoside hydrolase family 31 protein [Lacibacter sp.]
MARLFLLVAFAVCVFSSIAQSGFGNFVSVKQEPGTVTVTTTAGKLVFRSFPGSIVQTTFEANQYKGDQVSNAVLKKPEGPLNILKNGGAQLSLSNGKTAILISKTPVTITYNQGKSSIWLMDYRTTDEQHQLLFKAKEKEQFFGTGSRSIPVNKRGYKVALDNNPWYGYSTGADNLNYSVPFYISSNNYGIFLDNPSRGYIDFGKTASDVVEVGLKAGKLQFYTFFGNHAGDIVQQFTSLVGRMSLPPRWALGNFMSRFGYRTQDEVMSIAQKMKEQEFPFDAVIIDLFWFGDAQFGSWNIGNLDWNKQRFPEPEKMIADLKKQNIKTILITEPFVLSESFNYKYTQENKLNAVDKNGDTVGIKEFYFGYTGLLDIFQNKTKDWFWSKYNAQIMKGVDGWWGDLGEPEKHPNYVYHNMKDFGMHRLFNADEVHNIYGHEWSKMLFDKYAKHYPQQRLFHLNRSGYAGTWRFGSVPWSGDVDRSWNGFKAQLPVIMGMSLSGVPMMHSDAGGFAMGQRDPELYLRWLQMAVFTAVFRPHGSVNAPEPGSPQIESEPVFYDEPIKSILRKFVQLRYQLMPYTYTAMYEAATKGTPLVRPMFYSNSTDSNLYKATDQFMFGDALLIAPVLEKSAAKRKLYLPKGDWYNFWNPTAKQQGGQWIEVDVTTETIPVFVKAGSVIPMKPMFNNTADYPAGQIILHYYASNGTQQSFMYEDDGSTTNAIQKNQFELIRFSTAAKDNSISFTINSNNGQYKGKPALRNINLMVHGISNTKQVLIDGKPLSNWARTNDGLSVPFVNWKGGIKKLTVK